MGVNFRLLFFHRAWLGVLVACVCQAAWIPAAYAQAPPGIPTKNPDLTHEDPRIKRVIIRREGDDGAKSYRIPGMTVTPKGAIVACFDIRRNGSGDLPASIDVGVLRSNDQSSVETLTFARFPLEWLTEANR